MKDPTKGKNLKSVPPERAIKELLGNMVSCVDVSPARTEFRASSLPYCGILDYRNMVLKPPSSFDYGGTHYTTIGTAVHEFVQAKVFKMNRGMLFGTWRCLHNDCGKLHYNQLEPSSCEGCGATDRNFFYEELEVAYPVKSFKLMETAAKAENLLMSKKRHLCGDHVFTGHVDGVFRASDGKYYILEYKTTSTNKAETGRSLPVKYHHHQARRYAGLVTALHGITLSGYFLIYIGRDTAAKVTNSLTGKVNLTGIRPYFVATDAKVRKTEMLAMSNEYKQRRAALALAKDMSNNPAEKFLLDHKPCSGIASYKENFFKGYMDRDEHGTAVYPCPYANGEVCFKMKSIKLEAKT